MAAPQKSRWRGLLRLSSSVFGAALVGAIGWVLAQTSFSVGTAGDRTPGHFGWLAKMIGEGLARFSYDVPFVHRGSVVPPPACIVYMDESAGRNLGQSGQIWDRTLHTQLLQRLAEDPPRAVFFDVVFSEESPIPGADEAFAEAIRNNGRVFLAAAAEGDSGIVSGNGIRISASKVLAPIRALREAAAGWGLISLKPLDGDYGVRRIAPGSEDRPSAPWRAALKLGAALEETLESRMQVRWMNYYGPPGVCESMSFDRALRENELPPGYFRDRIVVVGGRSTLGGMNLGKDDFRNPYSIVGGPFSSGAEIHLTALLNLLNGEWLTRLDERSELWIAILAGVVLGGVLPRFCPHIAAILALGMMVAIGAFACWLSVVHRVWFAWGVPVFVQAPVALLWAVGARYFLEERRRKALRIGFGHYLSTQIADRIADSDFDLSPGGIVKEVTVLFTDLEGFTPLTEELKNPELITQVLLKYFAQTTAPILENDGLIVNFVGDAVTAVWGAPLDEPDHVRKAALAACRLHQTAWSEVDGFKLRTRVALHTGRVLAGNIGSAERFDYAVVGDPVNFASRLEGLNKHLGTNVLISDAIRQKLGDEFITRRLGEFRVVGKKGAHVIHEILGQKTDEGRLGGHDVFEAGVEEFRHGNLDSALLKMQEVLALCGGRDGPAEFYIKRIASLKKGPLPDDWKGIIEFAEK